MASSNSGFPGQDGPIGVPTNASREIGEDLYFDEEHFGNGEEQIPIPVVNGTEAQEATRSGSEVEPAAATTATGSGSEVEPAAATTATGSGSEVEPAAATTATGSGSEVEPAAATASGSGSEVEQAGVITVTGSGSEVEQAAATATGSVSGSKLKVAIPIVKLQSPSTSSDSEDEDEVYYGQLAPTNYARRYPKEPHPGHLRAEFLKFQGKLLVFWLNERASQLQSESGHEIAPNPDPEPKVAKVDGHPHHPFLNEANPGHPVVLEKVCGPDCDCSIFCFNNFKDGRCSICRATFRQLPLNSTGPKKLENTGGSGSGRPDEKERCDEDEGRIENEGRNENEGRDENEGRKENEGCDENEGREEDDGGSCAQPDDISGEEVDKMATPFTEM